MATYPFGLVFDWHENYKKLGNNYDNIKVSRLFNNSTNVTVLKNSGFTFVNFDNEGDLLYWFTRRGVPIINDMNYRVNHKKCIGISIFTQRSIIQYVENLLNETFKFVPEITSDKHAYLYFTNEKDAQTFYQNRSQWFPQSTNFVYKNRADKINNEAIQATNCFLEDFAYRNKTNSLSKSSNETSKLPSATHNQNDTPPPCNLETNTQPDPKSVNDDLAEIEEPDESGHNIHSPSREDDSIDLDFCNKNMIDVLKKEIIFCAKQSEYLMKMNRKFIDNNMFDESDSCEIESLVSINKKIKKIMDIYDDIKASSMKLKRRKIGD